MLIFFDRNKDHVFAFPRPNMKQTEGQYDFSDHMALLQFIYKNLHVNPIHQLFLSKEAKFKLQTIRNEHFEKLVDTVLNLCKKK